jgi:hypothetical protein
MTKPSDIAALDKITRRMLGAILIEDLFDAGGCFIRITGAGPEGSFVPYRYASRSRSGWLAEARKDAARWAARDGKQIIDRCT